MRKKRFEKFEDKKLRKIFEIEFNIQMHFQYFGEILLKDFVDLSVKIK